MNHVRKKLLKGIPEGNYVCDIANRWGFWDMGKFAMVYRRQFGELPSKTLKNRVTNI
ncbi:MAG: helix-turn-helix domain-containing protein [Desulfuromonadales bacterium]|nr:helix-turn-helix domain-containing protein [Desulfuromonadales bacterium]